MAPSVRTLYVYAASSAEQDAWLAALRRACSSSGTGAGGSSGAAAQGAGGAAAASGSSGSASPTVRTHNPAEGQAWRGNLCGDGAGAASVGAALEGFFESSNWGGDALSGHGGGEGGQAAPGRGARLPLLVDIDGCAVVGAELRVRGAHLESLCLAWFTLGGGSSSSSSGSSGSSSSGSSAEAALPLDMRGDVAKAPGFALIPGAKGQTWVVEGKYVGARVGCLVRPAVGAGGRWGLLWGSVAPPNPAAATLRLCPQPHQHRKYCDRRVRVCTAVGRYREGEVLCAVASDSLLAGAAGGGGAGWRYAWYRTAPLLDLEHPSGGGRGGGGTAAGAAEEAEALDRTALAGLAAARHGEGKRVTELEYTLVQPRAVGDLPPSPLDHEPAPTTEEIARALAPRALPNAPAGGSPQAPMFREDVGCMYVCLAVRGSSSGAQLPRTIVPATLALALGAPTSSSSSSSSAVLAVSQAVGPIEPAPPRAREIWITGATGPLGAPALGNLLVGCVYYYGGWEGRSRVSWVAINSEGETRELKGWQPSASPDVQALPEAGNRSSSSSGDAHPRALRVTEDLLGCIIKFKVQPVRWDGDEGHQESSRPTPEVVRA